MGGHITMDSTPRPAGATQHKGSSPLLTRRGVLLEESER